MTEKEKARAYDETINKLRCFMEQGVDPLITRADVQDFFPELKESEDEKWTEVENERIRKCLITFFQRFPYCPIESAGTNAKEALTWLEKQTPVKFNDKNDEKIRKELLESFKYQQRESRTDKEWLNGIKLSEVVAWLEKQGKNKSCKITFEDVLAIECSMRLAKITEYGDRLYEILVPLYNKIHNAYLVGKQDEQKPK